VTVALRTPPHRQHPGDASPATPAPSSAARRVQLRVVPGRRRAAGFAAFLSTLVAIVMLGAAVLHTRLAERQLEIDRLERSVGAAQERFDVLRRHRAELRSPNRLAVEAERLGMVPSAAGDFVAVDGWTIARAIAAAGDLPSSEDEIRALEPLDQYRLVKQVDVEGGP
jgi:hypothetical protein